MPYHAHASVKAEGSLRSLGNVVHSKDAQVRMRISPSSRCAYPTLTCVVFSMIGPGPDRSAGSHRRQVASPYRLVRSLCERASCPGLRELAPLPDPTLETPRASLTSSRCSQTLVRNASYVEMSGRACPVLSPRSVLPDPAVKAAALRAVEQVAEPGQSRSYMEIELEVFGATNLPKKDRFGACDGYVTVELRNERTGVVQHSGRTAIVWRELNPR